MDYILDYKLTAFFDLWVRRNINQTWNETDRVATFPNGRNQRFRVSIRNGLYKNPERCEGMNIARKDFQSAYGRKAEFQLGVSLFG